MSEFLFQPYEERLSVTLSKESPSLFQFPFSFWTEVSKAAGASVLAFDETPSVKHFLLSTSSLFVFSHSLILLTCAPVGVSKAFDISVKKIGRGFVERVNVQKRFPPSTKTSIPEEFKEQLLSCYGMPREQLLPCTHLYEWGRKAHKGEEATSMLFFSPEIVSFTQFKERLIVLLKEKSPSILEHFFPDEGYSLNATWGDSEYITLHYSPQQYLSIDLCVEEYFRTKVFYEVLAVVTGRASFAVFEGRISEKEQLFIAEHGLKASSFT